VQVTSCLPLHACSQLFLISSCSRYALTYYCFATILVQCGFCAGALNSRSRWIRTIRTHIISYHAGAAVTRTRPAKWSGVAAERAALRLPSSIPRSRQASAFQISGSASARLISLPSWSSASPFGRGQQEPPRSSMMRLLKPQSRHPLDWHGEVPFGS
jgi:hypothetical protein